jgi:hypothetical protein
MPQVFPWFAGHHRPRTPLPGELNEREPSTWERYIELARAAGMDVFLFDWYWFEGGPVFHEALKEGLLQAGKSARRALPSYGQL